MSALTLLCTFANSDLSNTILFISYALFSVEIEKTIFKKVFVHYYTVIISEFIAGISGYGYVVTSPVGLHSILYHLM